MVSWLSKYEYMHKLFNAFDIGLGHDLFLQLAEAVCLRKAT
jgi:hypothetical protein